MKKRYLILVAILIAAYVLEACGGNETLPTEVAPVVITKASTQLSPTSTETTVPIPMKSDPIRVEFQSADGTPLVGYYYPAAVPNAPIVVLMHWAGGDQTDWNKVGLVEWLRNWDQAVAGSSKLAAPLADVYTPMPEGLSFAVFTFDYRGYGESGGSGVRSKFVDDSIAALTQASQMDGVDPAKISVIGSSIGADGAADSCANFPCVGVLSLSPGSYLGVSYKEAVGHLSENGIPSWCLASEDDGESFLTCNKVSGAQHRSIIYPGKAHGTEFLMYGEAPDDIGKILLDWVLLVYNIN